MRYFFNEEVVESGIHFEIFDCDYMEKIEVLGEILDYVKRPFPSSLTIKK